MLAALAAELEQEKAQRIKAENDLAVLQNDIEIAKQARATLETEQLRLMEDAKQTRAVLEEDKLRLQNEQTNLEKQNQDARKRLQLTGLIAVGILGAAVVGGIWSYSENQTMKAKTIAIQQQADKDSARQNRFEEGQLNKFFMDFKKDSNKINDQLSDANQTIINVEAALKPDKDGTVSASRVQSALSNYARLMGEKGVLTDQDTGRQLAPTASMRLAQLENWFKTNPKEVRVPVELVSAMAEGLTDAKTALGTTAKMKTQNLRDTYGEPTAPTAHMFYKRGGDKILTKIEERAKNIIGAPQANASGLSPEEQAELEQLEIELKGK
jgi:hypothetical protein